MIFDQVILIIPWFSPVRILIGSEAHELLSRGKTLASRNIFRGVMDLQTKALRLQNLTMAAETST